MGRCVEEEDRAAADLFVLPSRRGIKPTDPGFDPEEFLDKLCEEAMSIQREKLREILSRNAEVEYLQRHGLGGRTDVESFRQCVPVVSYGDLEEDIMKLVKGEDQDQKRPIFTVDPIIHFDLRSQATISLASLATLETVSALQICILVQRYSLVTPGWQHQLGLHYRIINCITLKWQPYDY
jgi:hypothetical protein